MQGQFFDDCHISVTRESKTKKLPFCKQGKEGREPLK